MDSQTVYILVEATINDGNLDALEGVVEEMLAGSQKETGTRGYEWHLSADRKRCRLLESYADANALLAHFKGPVVQQLVPKLLEHCKVDRFEVYGDPGAEARAMMAAFGTEIFDRWKGLGRSGCDAARCPTHSRVSNEWEKVIAPLLVILIGRFGRQLQLLVRLIEQVLGLRRVALHVPLIVLLRGHDLLICLFAESLRRSQIGMMVGVDVLRRLLRDDYARAKHRSAQ